MLGHVFWRAIAASFVLAAMLLGGAGTAHAQEFPPFCSLPAGWTIPAGATSGWNAAFDSFASGICSLKSNPMGNSSKAQVEFTRTFNNESLRFAARVSSELSYDCLRLFVDGVEKNIGGICANFGGLGLSGTVDWAVHTVVIPDGAHTIRWSYEKDSSLSVGSDAAWIDNVEVVRTEFPLSCAMPVGWKVPAGANAGWAVATDSVNSGTCSLKSGAITDGGKAQIQLTAFFEAGTVSFARRVSSELNYDCLKLFVDGVEKNLGSICANYGGLGVSGPGTWGPVEFPITEGLHTLRWSYEKDGSVSTTPDAAWIDDLLLPPNIVVSPPGPPTLQFVNRNETGDAWFTYLPPTDNGGSPIVDYIVRWREAGSSTLAGEIHDAFLPSPFYISGLDHGPYLFTLSAANQYAEGEPSEVDVPNDACGAPAEGYSVASASFDSSGGFTFAPRAVNSPGTVRVVVTNNDGFVADVYLSIDSEGDFSTLADCQGIAPFGTCTIDIAFSPIASGTRTGTFNIDGPGKLRCTRETKQYNLTGTGVALNQTITFNTLANKTFGNAPFTVSATATSGLPVAFSSLTTGVCTVAVSTVTIVGAGTCTIAANQSGNTTYNPAPQVLQSFNVAKANQTITFDAIGNKAYGDVFPLSATTTSPLAVTFTSTTTGVCAVAGSTVTAIALGTCTVNANQAGNANYNPAPQVSQSFTVGKASQTITFNALPGKTIGDPPFTVSATASSNLVVAFSSLTPSTCTVSGTTVALVAVGTCTIAANQSGNTNYLAAPQVSRSFQIAVLGTFALTVTKTGSGIVTSSPAGIDCGATCAFSFTSGTQVTLSAAAANDSTFSGWSGACTGTGICSVTMDSAKAVTATFTANLTGNLVVRYRLFSPGTLEHLYTTDFNEYSVLPVCCAWNAEGPIYKVFSGPGSFKGVAATPYYRLYNPSSFQHHWTTDLNEYTFLASVGWHQEGTDGHILPTPVAGAVPLYRLYISVFGGLHLWTIDLNEANYLTANAGWVNEGIAGYVIPLP